MVRVAGVSDGAQCRGQSVVEYLIVVALLLAVLSVTATKIGSTKKQPGAVQALMDAALEKIPDSLTGGS